MYQIFVYEIKILHKLQKHYEVYFKNPREI